MGVNSCKCQWGVRVGHIFLVTRKGNWVRASFPLLAGEVTYYYPSPSCPLHNLIFSCDNALWKEIH